MPRYGGEKLWFEIKDDLVKHEIKMGRDQFMTFLREHHLLVKKTKKYHITTGWHSTNSKHFYYKSPNLIKDLVPTYAHLRLTRKTTTSINFTKKSNRKKRNLIFDPISFNFLLKNFPVFTQ